MLRYSANLGLLWADLPLLARMERAAAAGFHAVEMHWPYETAPESVRDEAGRLGLTLVSVNAPLGDRPGDFGLAARTGREEDFRASLEQGLAYAATAGFAKLHVLSGFVEEKRGLAERSFVGNIKTAAEMAGDAGISLLIEPMNAHDRPEYFLRRADDAMALIDEIGASNVELLFDTYHAAFEEEHVTAALMRSLPRLGHVQIAAHPDRCEPDQGTVDHGALLDALAASGWSGFVGAEYRPRGAAEEGLGWIEALGPAVRL
jgi:hydroxypyruvate isomerase